LHHIEDAVPEKMYLSELDKAQILRNGSDVTIVANSLMTIESMKAAEVLSEVGVDVEIVDLRSIKPIDLDTILKSVSKTKNLVVVDSSWKTGGISGEIISLVVESSYDLLERAPLRITSPDHFVPTSHYLADGYYQDAKQIAKQVLDFFDQQDGIDIINKKFKIDGPVDVPNKEFHGPF
jgi:pyruvate dehydrogenase E1 component beta subunit